MANAEYRLKNYFPHKKSGALSFLWNRGNEEDEQIILREMYFSNPPQHRDGVAARWIGRIVQYFPDGYYNKRQHQNMELIYGLGFFISTMAIIGHLERSITDDELDQRKYVLLFSCGFVFFPIGVMLNHFIYKHQPIFYSED